MWTGLLACLLFRHLRAEGLFKIQIPPEAKAHSVIPGRRVGHPLLGKWHLCSFVLSVIGLSALPDDSSRREAPAACQLRSIRLDPSLGCNSFFAEQRQSLTPCFFAFLPMFTPGESPVSLHVTLVSSQGAEKMNLTAVSSSLIFINSQN